MTFNDWVVYALLLFGLYLLLMDVKMWFAPSKKGRIVAVEDQMGKAERDCNCGTIRACRSHLTATVRTEDGDLVETDMSPCLVCMDHPEGTAPGAVGAGGFLLVDLERVSIVAVQAIPCRKPHEPPAVLGDTPHPTFRQAILRCEVLKSHRLSHRRGLR